MKKFILLFMLCMFICPLVHCEDFFWEVDETLSAMPPDPRYQARVLMRSMTEKEKIGQLLMVAPEDITGESRTERIAGENLFTEFPVGGVIIYGQNIRTEDQLMGLVEDIYRGCRTAGLYQPFIAMDEEGGYVSRLSVKLGEETAQSAEEIGQTGDAENAYLAGLQIGQRMKEYGFNLDLAPVADVLIMNAPELEGRSYGSDTSLVSEMAWRMAEGLREAGIIPCYKHFPGHGTIGANTHNTPASHSRTLQDMKSNELIPFQYGIDRDIEMIMLSHLTAKSVDAAFPASLSANIVTKLLRNEMGYDGVVITDALRMDAIREKYSIAEAVTLSLQAGADIMLVPEDGREAFRAIEKEIEKGNITWERIDKSVERIIALKIKSGLIQ